MLEKLEKQWLNQEGDGDEAALWYLGDNMTHAYYLDQLESFRPTWQILAELAMILMICIFIMGGLLILREKGQLHNFHQKWKV